jgi:outer membrane protein assembly factor BamB
LPFIWLSLTGSLAAQEVTSQPAAGTPQDVLTYHGDNLRTGWFSSETQLTPANVNSATFGLLATVALDGRVDAEPLVARQQTISGQGAHDVVYVATENNSVYAIDAASGAVLWQRNLGTAVPYTYKDSDDNVYPLMGILGTPVIDRSAGALYLVAFAS